MIESRESIKYRNISVRRRYSSLFPRPHPESQVGREGGPKVTWLNYIYVIESSAAFRRDLLGYIRQNGVATTYYIIYHSIACVERAF